MGTVIDMMPRLRAKQAEAAPLPREPIARPAPTPKGKGKWPSEEWPVVVRSAGPHEDLVDETGWLTLRTRRGLPVALFDPDDPDVEDATLYVVALERGERRLSVHDDDGVVWTFEVCADDDDVVDFDPDHPFNKGVVRP